MATRVVASHEMQKQLPELLLLVSKGDDIIIKKKTNLCPIHSPNLWAN